MSSEIERLGTAGNAGSASVEIFTAQFSSFSQQILRSMNDVSQLADKRASTFLLTLGTVLLILTMFWRLRPFGLQVSDLAPSEFITMAVVSSLFVLGGSFLRLYQEHLMSAVSKEMRDTGTKLLERAQETASSLVQKGMERNDRGV